MTENRTFPNDGGRYVIGDALNPALPKKTKSSAPPPDPATTDTQQSTEATPKEAAE